MTIPIEPIESNPRLQKWLAALASNTFGGGESR
jgi:hypothetical protein